MTTVLLVDDSPLVREVLRLHVEGRGLEVIGEAADGRQGVALAEELAPDVVILDQEMPEMTGLQALRALRKRVRNALVVLYSSDPRIRAAALRSGAQAYFQKGDDSPRSVVAAVIDMLAAAR